MVGIIVSSCPTCLQQGGDMTGTVVVVNQHLNGFVPEKGSSIHSFKPLARLVELSSLGGVQARG
jgi:hypothetical protein